VRRLLLATVLLLAACSTPSPAPTPSPSSSGPPPPVTFTDVSRGDTDSIVKLLEFRVGKNQAVVVEPVFYLPNPEFCDRFGIPLDDKQCVYEWDTKDSQAKITVPRADDAVFALVDHDNLRKCLDERGAGSCEVSAQEFDDWISGGHVLIRLVTRDGVAVRLAELNLPE
jgi:hypothetical protein